MEDNEIVKLFWQRSEVALRETERKYGRYCLEIATGILGNPEDAKEVFNDVLLRTWNSIPPQKPEYFRAYLAAICRGLAIDRLRTENRQKRGAGAYVAAMEELAECVPDGDPNRELHELLTLTDTLNRFLREQKERTRIIFIQRYWYFREISEIAEAFSISESTVKMTLLRTRRKLHAALTNAGIEV